MAATGQSDLLLFDRVQKPFQAHLITARGLAFLLTESREDRIARDLRSIRVKQREQDAADQFWRLWDLRWGVRKEMLLVGLGVALPTFLFGYNGDFLSKDYVWALAAFLFGCWTVFGLLPPYFLRQELTLRPSLAARFMARHRKFRDAKDFAKKLYRFLAEEFKSENDRKGLQTLVAFERVFEFLGRHAWWAFPAMIAVSLALAVLGVALSLWLAGQFY